MKLDNWDKFVFLVVAIFIISTFTSADWVRPNLQSTVNNTFYDASRSFALLDFANSCSVVSGSNVSSLSCSSGDASFLRFNSTSGNWSLSCCDFITTKCHWYNTSDMFNFTENKEFADNTLNIKYDGGFGVMCCNSQMNQCFKKLVNLSCDEEYDQIIVSMSFNTSSNNWSVTSCLDGFR